MNFERFEPLVGIAFPPRPLHPDAAEQHTSKAPQGAFLLRDDVASPPTRPSAGRAEVEGAGSATGPARLFTPTCLFRISPGLAPDSAHLFAHRTIKCRLAQPMLS